MRATPPDSLSSALTEFDSEVRSCLEQLCTGPLPAEAWKQASLSTSSGGLGLRHAEGHAAAAYVASVSATRGLCQELDPAYQLSWPAVDTALAKVNAAVLPADRVPVPAPPDLRQQTLSRALDRATVAGLMAPGARREALHAHLQLLQQPGSGAWLHAPPSRALGLHLEAPLFKVLVQLRLRLPVADSDSPCPLCDGTADRFGGHSRPLWR